MVFPHIPFVIYAPYLQVFALLLVAIGSLFLLEVL